VSRAGKAINLSRQPQAVDSFEVVASSGVARFKQCSVSLESLSKLKCLEKRIHGRGFDGETIQPLYLCERYKHEKLHQEP